MPGTTVTLTPLAAPVSGGEQTAHVRRYTAHDAQEIIMRHWGSNPSTVARSDARFAILSAYREIATPAQWHYLYTLGWLNLNGAYRDGTVAYDHAGGAYERMLTLTSGTWPTWARLGYLRIGAVAYKVERRISDSILVLDSVMNPGADVDSGTAYVLAQDTYELATDFQATYNPGRESIWGGMCYIRPEEWSNRLRSGDSAGDPSYFTFTGQDGRLVMQISPPAESATTIDVLYYRRPRQINVWDYTTGRATVDTGTFPKRVALSGGGAFTSAMVGSVIRLSSTATKEPTGWEGDNAPAQERTVKVFISSSSVEVDEDFDASYTGVAHRISDPIDLEDGLMNAFWRCIEKQGAIIKIMKGERGEAEMAYRSAITAAKEADVRVLSARAAGVGGAYQMSLKGYQRGDDVE